MSKTIAMVMFGLVACVGQSVLAQYRDLNYQKPQTSSVDASQNPWFRSIQDRSSVLQSASSGSCATSPLGDALGDAADTFGAGPPLLDINTVTVSTDGANLFFSITFNTPISPASSGALNAVVGILEFDTDQNTATGLLPLQNVFAPPFAALSLGIDFIVDLSSELSNPGFVNVLDVNAGAIVGAVPITYGPQNLSGTIPLSLLGDDDGLVDFASIIGTVPQPTDALEQCGTSSADGPPQACIENAGFETGNFESWIANDLVSPFFLLQVGGPGLNPGFDFFTSSPTEGNLAALHGWDGDGPGTIIIAQQITVPLGETSIFFDYRAAWDMMNFGATLDRTFEVVIRPAGGGDPLQAPVMILTAVAGDLVLDTGNLLGEVDVSSFAGQTIVVSFEWFVSENFSGPAFFQLDNVRCNNQPATCDFVDADGDGDIDLVDFARFLECFMGPQ